MLISKQKLYTLLELINDKLNLSPIDARIYIDTKHDLKDLFSKQELANLLLKFQNDEKILKIVQSPPPPEYCIDEEDSFYAVVIRQPAYNKYFSKIENTQEYKNFKLFPSNIARDKDDKIILKITYKDTREILINDFFLIARPDFNSENDLVFTYLYNHPNEVHTLDAVKKATNQELIKSPHKITENLGFTGDLKTIFFTVTKDSISFRNPITRADLNKIGIANMRLPR